MDNIGFSQNTSAQSQASSFYGMESFSNTEESKLNDEFKALKVEDTP